MTSRQRHKTVQRLTTGQREGPKLESNESNAGPPKRWTTAAQGERERKWEPSQHQHGSIGNAALRRRRKTRRRCPGRTLAMSEAKPSGGGLVVKEEGDSRLQLAQSAVVRTEGHVTGGEFHQGSGRAVAEDGCRRGMGLRAQVVGESSVLRKNIQPGGRGVEIVDHFKLHSSGLP